MCCHDCWTRQGNLGLASRSLSGPLGGKFVWRAAQTLNLQLKSFQTNKKEPELRAKKPQKKTRTGTSGTLQQSLLHGSVLRGSEGLRLGLGGILEGATEFRTKARGGRKALLGIWGGFREGFGFFFFRAQGLRAFLGLRV